MSEPRSPVLLTGATGFIGRHLHTFLLDAGFPVRALVRPRSVTRADLDPRCDVVPGELTDARAWRGALAGAGHVVYGAGAVRGRTAADFEPANVAGVTALVEALSELPEPPPLLLLSSLAASRPGLSHYAASKRAGERVVEAATRLSWCVLRPPAVYGPGDTEMLPVLRLVRRGLVLRPGPRGQRLALLHVADLVRAVAAELANPLACRHQTFAIDDGHADGYGWDEIALAVAGRRVPQVGLPGPLLQAVATLNAGGARWLGYRPILTPGKVRELQQPGWLCDNRAFTHATGWLPEMDLERGAATLFH